MAGKRPHSKITTPKKKTRPRIMVIHAATEKTRHWPCSAAVSAMYMEALLRSSTVVTIKPTV